MCTPAVREQNSVVYNLIDHGPVWTVFSPHNPIGSSQSNSHASASVDLFPLKLLLTRTISSHFTPRSQSPTKWSLSFNFLIKLHAPWVPAFPTSTCRSRTKFGSWMREAAEHCRVGADPSSSSQHCSFPAAWPRTRHYTSELHFIVCKLNNSLSHILRILYTTKGG